VLTIQLEGANIKLGSVISEINGKSSRQMLDMLVAGYNDVNAIADKARRQMRKKISQIEEVLQGFMGDHQRVMLRLMLQHIDILDAQILSLDQEIQKKMIPVNEQVSLVDSIPGVGERSAQVIIAEIGINMNQFPSAAHLLHGLDYALATMKVQANAKVGKPVMEAIYSKLRL